MMSFLKSCWLLCCVASMRMIIFVAYVIRKLRALRTSASLKLINHWNWVRCVWKKILWLLCLFPSLKSSGRPPPEPNRSNRFMSALRTAVCFERPRFILDMTGSDRNVSE